YKYSNAKLTRKVLRLLPEHFAIKVIVIEKAKDIDTMIIGPLQIFKMNLKEIKKMRQYTQEKKKSLSVTCNDDDFSSELEKDEKHLSNYVAFTLKIVIAVATDLDNYNDSEAKSVEDFMETYNRLLNKWGMQDK
ncbi:hypothetical protein Goari_020480, partial [Gossypium aridum]|nr:hypothetical protein [Gossypium aridum]